MAITENVTGNNAIAITGSAKNGANTVGVRGIGDAVGVRGEGKTWHGVAGLSESTTGGNGVFGANPSGTGVRGESEARFNAGVYGLHKGDSGWGVLGEAANGAGTVGKSKTWHGVYGETESITGGAGVCGEHRGKGAGVSGDSKDGIGVLAHSEHFEAVHAETNARTVAAIAAYANNPEGTGAAIYAHSRSRGPAGYFKGDVEVTGSLRVNGRKVLVGQQSGLVSAYSPDDEDIIGSSITIQVANRHITAEVAIFFVVNEDEDEHLVNVGISQIVSDSGVETKLGPFVERTGVTSITFFATAWASFVHGRWIINFWS
jgi:hypothetical protein